jgi:hypothetical protein
MHHCTPFEANAPVFISCVSLDVRKVDALDADDKLHVGSCSLRLAEWLSQLPRGIKMADLIDTIMAAIGSDPTITAKGITLDTESKGFLKRKKVLNINGLVATLAERNAVMQVVLHHVGDSYEIVNKLVVM